MSSDSKALYEFRKQLEALKKFQGRGTELISVYITPGYNISEIVNKLKEEYGQASNIKSATTKKNVQSALEKIMHFLKGANKPPENGMAVFCGNVSESEGKIDIEIYSVVPPMPVPVQFYRCESRFVLEPLEELLDVAGTYGLVVLDGKECTVALLKGKTVKVLKKLESTAHQKVHKGGQCVHENTVILTSNGIKKASEVKEGEKILSFNFNTLKTVFAPCTKVMKRKSTEEFILQTEWPSKFLRVTGEHKVFVLTTLGIAEKNVCDLKKGDVLISAWNAPIQELSALESKTQVELLGEVQGYFLGDGTIDGNRFVFYDADEQVIKHYSQLACNIFNCNSSIRKRIHGFSKQSKNPRGCYESKIYSKSAVETLKKEHPEISKKKIPALISKELAKGFLRGLFDAEGSVSTSRFAISLAMVDEDTILKTASLLSLFGVSTSVYRKKATYKQQFGIDITDEESLKNFALSIGFNGAAKSRKLAAVIAGKRASGKGKRVLLNGRVAAKIAKDLEMRWHKWFETQNMFLQGERFMSRQQFVEGLLPAFSRRVEELAGSQFEQKALEHLKFLKAIAESDGCISIVKNVEKVGSTSEDYYDFEVPETNCFVANGLVIHNSAARFQRLAEEGIEYYYKRVGEAMNAFIGQKNFKGVIVGGPGPAKDNFMKMSPFNYQLKVLGVVDTGYTDEFGLRELLEKSGDLIAEQEAIVEKKLLNEFLTEAAKGGLVAWGLQNVREVLAVRKASKLLVTEGLEIIENEKNVVSHLISQAEEQGTEVVFVSEETPEGQQFRGTFGGLGVFLRYK